jgi:16S rRNA (uracil1498-N3)-methyltransferase
MTSPLFVVDAAVLQSVAVGTEVVVGGAEGRHAVTVKRLRVDESVVLTDGVHRAVTGAVTRVEGKDVLVVRVDDVRDLTPRDPSVCVVQAVPKGERAELAVAMLTEVGVDEIVPFMAQRCVVQWQGARGERAREGWQATARESGKQARRERHPVIGATATSRDVAALIETADAAFVLHEDASTPLANAPITTTGRLVLVVGPEGGLTDDEVAIFTGVGAHAVHLGPSVMRTSTAGAVAAGVLLARTARWA